MSNRTAGAATPTHDVRLARGVVGAASSSLRDLVGLVVRQAPYNSLKVDGPDGPRPEVKRWASRGIV